MTRADATVDAPLQLLLGVNRKDAKTERLLAGTHLEIIRLVVPAGKEIPPHKAKGEATVLCLEGRVFFTSTCGAVQLTPGMLVYLRPGEVHALTGTEDSSLLVTLHREQSGQAVPPAAPHHDALASDDASRAVALASGSSA